MQLRQGQDRVLTDLRDAVDLAGEFGRFGPVAVVDLDAAMGTGSNVELLRRCCATARCHVGGGIRSAEDVRRWIRWGAEKVMIGTAATPAFLSQFPREWLIAAIDARDDEVVVEGWTRPTGQRVADAAVALAPHCSALLFTCVEREGMLGGGAVEAGLSIQRSVDIPVIVAGGIADIDEVRRLVAGGCHVQLGRAVYEKRLDLVEAWVAQIQFDDRGLVPTVVQDDASGAVRMLAYSSAESLRKALGTGQGWYFSRSREKLWRKGGTSGHIQELRAARWDCDRDAVLFRIDQRGPTCHSGQNTCFGSASDDVLKRLAGTIAERQTDGASSSYTARLLTDRELVQAKLREEIEEVIDASAADDIAWETADVVYHLLVHAAGRGVGLERVCDELRSRMRS